MNYELAKQLKDAGYPQGVSEGSGYWESDKFYRINCVFNNMPSDWVYCPELSDLIEACGDHFDGLSKFNGVEIEDGWVAFNKGWKNFDFGKTPEEAVAKLWLALHKK